MSLERLGVFENTDSWIFDWDAAAGVLHGTLNSRKSSLSISLSKDSRILQIVDEFLTLFSKNDDNLWEVSGGFKYQGREEEFEDIVTKVYTAVLMLFMRFSTERKQLKRELNLFSLNRLFLAIKIFKASNQEVLEKIILEAFKMKHITEDAIAECMKNMEKKLVADCKEIDIYVAFSRDHAENAKRILEKHEISIEALATLLPLLPKHHSLHSYFYGFVNRPLVASTDGLLASGCALFNAILKLSISGNKLYFIISNSLNYERFIFYYNIMYPVEEVIDLLEREEQAFVVAALKKVALKQNERILEQLKSRGLLANLGCSLNETVRKLTDEIIQSLPHLSPEFVHLCLRHFGYKMQETKNTLISFNDLPLDLRALFSVDLKARAISAHTSECYPISNGADFDNFKSISNAVTMSNILPGSVIRMKSPEAVESESISEDFNLDELAECNLRMNTLIEKCKMNMDNNRKLLSKEAFVEAEPHKFVAKPDYEGLRKQTKIFSYDCYDDEYDDSCDDYLDTFNLDYSSDDFDAKESPFEKEDNEFETDNESTLTEGSQEQKEVNRKNISGVVEAYGQNRWRTRVNQAYEDSEEEKKVLQSRNVFDTQQFSEHDVSSQKSGCSDGLG
ncbi:unnamed protein product [Thelazia callipaeda]|uniref:CUE domain-containing protein n=1 Tax=Thelazia callipaeda TaxID=103827 RepID=A0A0N5D243_THECL|nr:unnamed protein product [Thelazia callipaeda]